MNEEKKIENICLLKEQNINENIYLKKAKKNNFSFCYKIMKSSMNDYAIKHWKKWPKEYSEKEFIKSLKKTYPLLIMENNKKIGFLNVYIHQPTERIILQSIYLISEKQNQKIGTIILELICKSADKKQLPIDLSYFYDNPAKKLYHKFNFNYYGSGEQHEFVRRKPILNNKLKLKP